MGVFGFVARVQRSDFLDSHVFNGLEIIQANGVLALFFSNRAKKSYSRFLESRFHFLRLFFRVFYGLLA